MNAISATALHLPAKPDPKPHPNWFGRHRPIYERVKPIMFGDFPALFDPKCPLPLKIGIRGDLVLRYRDVLAWNEIAVFLTFWCRRLEYLKSLSASEHRYGVDGSEYPLSAEHKAHAVAQLAKIAAGKKRGRPE